MTTEGNGVQQLRTVEESSHPETDLPNLSTRAEPADTDTAKSTTEPAAEPEPNADLPTLARFASPRTERPTTLAVFADPHLSTEKAGTWKVFHRTERRLRAAVEDANDRGVDGVVVAGDLTEDGRPADFDGVAQVLEGLDAPFVAVPGNHDVPKSFKDHDTPSVSEFEKRFTPGELPFRTRIGGVDVLGLNSAVAPDGSLDATHDGAISDDQLAWLESTLPETDAALVVSHHNLPGLESCVAEDGYAPHPPVGDAPQFVDALAGSSALHLSGHVHLPAAISGDVSGLVCPALSSFPQAYTLAEVGPEGTTLRLVPVADEEGVTEAHELARDHSDRSADICEMVEAQLADLPLVDEQSV